jgi:vitamin B12/bleomycin/antimicrobial peptide transport system ATP-binding/permease protein
MPDASSPAVPGGVGVEHVGPPPSYIARSFFRMASGFWTGPRKRQAWLLTIGVLAFALVNLAAALGVNRWNKFFFDALEQKNMASVVLGIGIVLSLAVASAAASVGLVHMRMRLQLRWRQWLTGYLVRRWLGERRFYQLNIVGGDASNPEFRIADDARLAIEPLVDFVNGLTNAVLAAAAFIGVLWAVGGAISFEAFGSTYAIPGYMVFAAVAYSGLTSFATILIGRPLIRRSEAKNAGEARLRYELTRVRDSAENIALIGGDDDERLRLRETFNDLAHRWIRVIVQQARMTWISYSNLVLAPAVPLLLGAPKYLSGEFSLGELMQVATAFTQVQVALNWLVDNAIRLAEWFASAQRVVELTDALKELEDTIGTYGSSESVVLGHSPDEAIHINNLSLTQHNGRLMIEGADTAVGPGEKVIVKGESGTGKSTLIRAMAGLWPWGSGEILRPPKASIAFMPQRPYIPLGTLRHAVLYPHTDRDVPNDKIEEALKRCGLNHLMPRLDEEDNWDGILSGGEKQRVAFARLLVNPPDIVIMDEATSALDEESQARMMEFLRTDLVDATVLSVTHRPGLEEFFDREINLVREGGAPARTFERRYPRLRRMWQRVRRRPEPGQAPPPEPGQEQSPPVGPGPGSRAA